MTQLLDSLDVLAITDDEATAELLARICKGSHDRVGVARDLETGLQRAAAEVPDIVMVRVALGENAGLAVVHHLRAVAPGVIIYALADKTELEIGAQAVALGSTGVLMLPLSGDELLTVLAEVRTRRAEQRMRMELERETSMSRRVTSLVAELAELGYCRNRREAAERLLPVLMSAMGVRSGVLYLPAGERSRQLMRAAVVDEPGEPPSFCEEMQLLEYAAEHELDVVRIGDKRERQGLALLGGGVRTAPSSGHLELLCAQAATALALVAEREQSGRSAMKDPESSAYTFAYFVDVAGREIDKARRYQRRFALATVAIGESGPNPVETAERVLAVVRDTDVLARVDDREFYLLMPETGGMGAHICRRRILRELVRGSSHQGVAIGVATFPHDGGDLSQLFRVARERSEASECSLVWRPDLARMPIDEVLEALLWSMDVEAPSVELPRRFTVDPVDLIGVVKSAVIEGLRGGAIRVVATHRAPLSIAAAVEPLLPSDREIARLDTIDIARSESCGHLEALLVLAQHGAYALLGRHSEGQIEAIHAADPLFVDFIAERLSRATGTRLLD